MSGVSLSQLIQQDTISDNALLLITNKDGVSRSISFVDLKANIKAAAMVAQVNGAGLESIGQIDIENDTFSITKIENGVLKLDFANLPSGGGNVVDNGTFPVSNGTDYVNSSLTEEADAIVSSKALRVPDGGALEIGPTLDIFTSGEEIGFRDFISGEQVNMPYRRYFLANGSDEEISMSRRGPATWTVLQPDDSYDLTILAGDTVTSSFTSPNPAYVAGYKVRGKSGKLRVILYAVKNDGSRIVTLDTLEQGIELDFSKGRDIRPGVKELDLDFNYELGYRTNQVTEIELKSADSSSVVVCGKNNVAKAQFSLADGATSKSQFLLYFSAYRADRYQDKLFPVDDTANDALHTLTASEINTRIGQGGYHYFQDSTENYRWGTRAPMYQPSVWYTVSVRPFDATKSKLKEVLVRFHTEGPYSGEYNLQVVDYSNGAVIGAGFAAITEDEQVVKASVGYQPQGVTTIAVVAMRTNSQTAYAEATSLIGGN